MNTKFAALGLALLKGAWQISRYLLATSVTALALAVSPVLAITILAIVGGIGTGMFALLMFVGAISGSADPPIAALFLAIALPIGFVIAMTVMFTAVLPVVFVFVCLIVLPISLLIEVVLQHIPVHSIFARGAGFLLAGGIAGLAACVVWGLFSFHTNALLDAKETS
jgi:hypothetical protein